MQRYLLNFTPALKTSGGDLLAEEHVLPVFTFTGSQFSSATATAH